MELIKQALSLLDPTNPVYDTIPGLKQTREFSRNLGSYDPATDNSIPFSQRLPMYLQKYGEGFMGAHGGFGKPPVPMGDITKAAQLLKNQRGAVSPFDIRTIGKFGELVETGKASGNMGELGQTIQSLITNLFGTQAKDWGNKKVKTALDLLLKEAMKK